MSMKKMLANTYEGEVIPPSALVYCLSDPGYQLCVKGIADAVLSHQVHQRYMAPVLFMHQSFGIFILFV